MPYYDVANLLTVTLMKMIVGMPCAYGTLRTIAVRLQHQVSNRAAQWSQLLSKFHTDLHSGFSCSRIWLCYKSNLVASWMHPHNYRCFQEHLRILLQSLGALCIAPGVSGSIWKDLEAMVRSTRVSGRSVCGFRTTLHFADDWSSSRLCDVELRYVWKWSIRGSNNCGIAFMVSRGYVRVMLFILNVVVLCGKSLEQYHEYSFSVGPQSALFKTKIPPIQFC